MAGAYSEMYNLVKTGRVFHGCTAAAGVAIPATTASSAATTVALWNPAGNIYNAAILSMRVGLTTSTSAANSGVPGAIVYNTLTGAGAAIATAGPVSAFTQKTPSNALTGYGTASTMLFAGSSTITFNVTGTPVGQSGMSILTTLGTTTSAPMFELVDDQSSMWIVGPGTVFYITQTTAETALMTFEMIWAELQ
jgi:hypothetical protein